MVGCLAASHILFICAGMAEPKSRERHLCVVQERHFWDVLIFKVPQGARDAKENESNGRRSDPSNKQGEIIDFPSFGIRKLAFGHKTHWGGRLCKCASHVGREALLIKPCKDYLLENLRKAAAVLHASNCKYDTKGLVELNIENVERRIWLLAIRIGRAHQQKDSGIMARGAQTNAFCPTIDEVGCGLQTCDGKSQ